jgi:sugar phosphate isomerase/epimerase
MRLGAPVGSALGGQGQQGTASAQMWNSPEEWASYMRSRGYGAAFCPIDVDADDETVDAYARAAVEADIVIAEVIGRDVLEFNLLDPDEHKRREAIAYTQRRLALADRIGARCCVGLTGSCRGAAWEPQPENLTDEAFALVVDTTREIIDAVAPQRAGYAPEILQWLLPYSIESYQRLLDAVDRQQLRVHLDPVNLIDSPQAYLRHRELTRECFRVFGERIVSCHAKDVRFSLEVTHKVAFALEEVPPGLGAFDYRTFLLELDRLDPDTPLMLEHLTSDAEYAEATQYVRSVAAAAGVQLR